MQLVLIEQPARSPPTTALTSTALSFSSFLKCHSSNATRDYEPAPRWAGKNDANNSLWFRDEREVRRPRSLLYGTANPNGTDPGK